jgi:nucleotide-binding universal stress UspA family protein
MNQRGYFMFKKVLVPLDYSEVAPGILPYIVYLAKSLDIPVELMSVLDQDNLEALEKIAKDNSGECPLELTAVNSANPGRPVVTFEETVRKDSREYTPYVIENAVMPVERWLSDFVAQLNQQGVRAEGIISVGTQPAQEILRRAREQGFDLIAMATHNRNLLGQAIRGSAANEVVRSASAPVLVVTPEKIKMSWNETPGERQVTITSVLVPLDGSPFAETGLPYVEYLAQGMSLEVVLVRAVEVGVTSTPLPYAGGVPVDPGDVEAQVEAGQTKEQEASRYLQQVANSLASKGLSVRWELLRGVPNTTISGLAQELSDNIIALASHGRSGLARWVQGSVAEDLIRATGDPVLVIPAELATEEEGARVEYPAPLVPRVAGT